MPTAAMSSHATGRLPGRSWLIVGAGFALLAGLDGALVLLGVWSPLDSARLSTWHGPLMVLGFIGTVITLERAVALGRPAGYLVPACSGLGAVALATPTPTRIGPALLTVAQVGLLAIYVPLWRRNRDDATVIQLAGALCSTGAAALLTVGWDPSQVVGWLASSMILTIIGERLELSRLTMVRNRVLPAVSAALVASLVISVVRPGLGWRLLGAVLVVLALWLLRHDVARAGLRRGGQAAFIGGMLMVGYLWLAVAGTVWLLAGPLSPGRGYDAAVHAVFLGFTMGMVLGHVTIILPAVLRARMDWTPWFWVPAVLLEGSLVTRIGVGDALGRSGAVRAGGVVNVLSLLTLVIVIVCHVRPRRTRA